MKPFEKVNSVASKLCWKLFEKNRRSKTCWKLFEKEINKYQERVGDHLKKLRA